MEQKRFTGGQNEIRLEDIPQYQSSFSRENIKSLSNLEKNRVTILFPDEFYNATIEMCNAKNESRGVLLVSTDNSSFREGKLMVCAMLNQAEQQGSAFSVFLDKTKHDAMTNLLNDYKDKIQMIEFHSHTKSTGDYWADKFSGQDNQSLANAINRHRGYMHVLFTPNNILTFGKGKPQIGVAKINKFDPLETQAYWQHLFNEYLKRG